MRRITKFIFVDELCFLVFVLLKVLGAIKWTWVWILSPLWILGSIIGVCLALSIFAVGIKGTLDKVSEDEEVKLTGLTGI